MSRVDWRRRAERAEADLRILHAAAKRLRGAHRAYHAEIPGDRADLTAAEEILDVLIDHVTPPPTRAARSQEEQRDAALDMLAKKRAEVVAIARAVAEEIAAREGTVTSPQVLAEMRARGHGDLLDAVDRRFMGVVFRLGWVASGHAQTGSHKRSVPVWRRVHHAAPPTMTTTLLGL